MSDYLLAKIEYFKKIDEKILHNIKQHKEIGHLELARLVNLDRKNLGAHMKRLIKKGIVKRGSGKQGKYSLE
jgi:DNA-binding MarR family transcriptional regulator